MVLSSGLVSFLQTLLTTQPSVAHSLIQCISHSQPERQPRNTKSLQLAYINAINTLLDCLSSADIDDERKKAYAMKIYEVLSKFHLEIPVSSLPIRTLFTKLIEHATQEPHIISNTDLLSVLAGLEDTSLLEEFCNLEYEIETNRAVETYQACAELTEEQRQLLHIMSLTDAGLRWKILLIFAGKRKAHVLELVLVRILNFLGIC